MNSVFPMLQPSEPSSRNILVCRLSITVIGKKGMNRLLSNKDYITELSHMGKLREVREVRGKLRDKCPTFYDKRLLSLNFPNDRRE